MDELGEAGRGGQSGSNLKNRNARIEIYILEITTYWGDELKCVTFHASHFGDEQYFLSSSSCLSVSRRLCSMNSLSVRRRTFGLKNLLRYQVLALLFILSGTADQVSTETATAREAAYEQRIQ